MALQGSLQELRLGDVVQTVLQAGNRGLLRVRSSGRRAVLYLSPEGVRLLEPAPLDERVIVEAFVRRGTITEDVVARAQAVTGGKAPLDGLVTGGSIPAEDLRRLLLEVADDAAIDVLTWTEGDFRFEEGAAVEGDHGPVSTALLDAAGLVLRAAQRMDERRRVAERIGLEARLILRIPGGGEGSEPPDAVAAAVLDRLDGNELLDETALALGFGPFFAQKAACDLVESGFARLPSSEELSGAAKKREAAGDLRAAKVILAQWQVARPHDAAPFVAAAELAARTGRYEDEAEALKSLGRVHLESSRAQDARVIFERLLQKRPGDRDALEGLRQATKIQGDEEGFSDTSQRRAEQALEGGDAVQASAILHELLEARPDALDARILRTKALVRLGDRAQALEEIERVAQLLPSRAKRRSDREAASWALETLAHLAPDRADLSRRFRSMTGGDPVKRRRAVILGSLLLVASGVGFALWPKPAAGLLARANAAADRGDASTALALVGEIAERWPNTSEADQAVALKLRLTRATVRDPAKTPKPGTSVKELTAAAVAALPRLPAVDSTNAIELLATALKSPDGEPQRGVSTQMIRGPLSDAVAALRREAQSRRDALDLAAAAGLKPPADPAALEAIVEKARSSLDPAWVDAAEHAARAVRRLASLLDESAFSVTFSGDIRSIEGDIAAAARAVAARPKEVDRARRELHRVRILSAYEKARVDAAGVLARGDLDAAEAYYRRLDSLLTQMDEDPAYRPLKDSIERRGILEFAHGKGEMMASIRKGLTAARAAEDSGNLAGAASSYAALAKQFPLVKFDAVFTIPVRVESIPPGATVAINGQISGPAPTVVRYGWGSQAIVTVDAEGYEAASIVLKTSEREPDPLVRVTLTPRARWTRAVVGIVEAPPLGVQGDVILANRGGRVERRSKETGEVLWAVDTRSLEGARGRPVIEGDVLWVPFLDGTVGRFSAADGALRSPAKLPSRPIGDAAAVAGKVAVAVDDGVFVFGANEDGRRVPIAGVVSAGVLAAHGAFWVGDSAGALVRIDPATFAVTRLALGGKVPVTSLAGGTSGVFVAASDGSLALADAADANVLWRRTGVGDVLGAPAPAGDLVSVADPEGHVRFYAAASGAPRGERDLGSSPRGGLRSQGSRIFAALADGRLWVYDAVQNLVWIDTPLQGTARIPAADLGDGAIVVPAAGNGLSAIPLPK